MTFSESSHLMLILDRLELDNDLASQTLPLCRAFLAVSDYPSRVKLHACKKLIQSKSEINVTLAEKTLSEIYDDPITSSRELYLCGLYFSMPGNEDQTISSYQKSIALAPSASACHNLAIVYKNRYDISQAEHWFQQAIVCDATHNAARYNLLTLLAVKADETGINRIIDEGSLDKEQKAKIYNMLGQYLAYKGRIESAKVYYQKAADLIPDSIAYQWSSNLTFSLAYYTQEDIKKTRKQYLSGLQSLNMLFDSASVKQKSDALNCLLLPTNFETHYQSENDTEVQIPYGKLIHKIAKNSFPDLVDPIPSRPDLVNGKIRIGFAAVGFFGSHSNYKTHGAWITMLDKQKFEIFCYDLGRNNDRTTKIMKDSADHFHVHSGKILQTQNQILKDQLDVLVYPGISMDPAVHRLASLRLCPVQCTSWGHPVTSGLPTIDYFLSSDLMEPDNGQDFYTEKLIRLPNLGIAQIKPSLPNEFKSPSMLQNRTRAKTILFCSQNILKLLPKHDQLFAKVAKRLPEAELWFIESKKTDVNTAFKTRMIRVFSDHDLNFEERCLVFPRLGKKEFCYVNKEADIMLDTCFWSGCNTTFESMLHNTPIVTLPGNTMRGRHTYSILKMMGLNELIATDEDDYVELVDKLASDRQFRERTVEHIDNNKEIIFSDPNAMKGFEEFISNNVFL